MTEHSKLFSPSAAGTWVNCPGQPRLSQLITHRLPRVEDDNPATLGNQRHHLAERMIALESPEDLRHEDDYDLLDRYVSSVRMNKTYFIEQKVCFNSTLEIEGGFGTPDCVVIHEDGNLEIKDLKTGFLKVSPHSWQLKLYALGAIETYNLNPETVKLSIYQPTIGNYDSIYLSADELYYYGEVARVSARKVTNLVSKPLPVVRNFLVPGESQCRYCEVRHLCPALRDEVKDIVRRMEVLNL